MILRGEIWWADLPEPVGSEPGFRRPLLIISANAFNRSALQTALGVILTANLGRAESSGNVLLSRRHSGLPKDSVVNVTQVLTVNKDALTECVGQLPGHLLAEVEEGLRLAMSL